MLLNTVDKQESPTLPDPNEVREDSQEVTSELHAEEHTGVHHREKIRALCVKTAGGTMTVLERLHSYFHFAGKSSILPLLHKLYMESKHTSKVSNIK